MDATEHVLLHSGGSLVEAPQLAPPHPPTGTVWRWVATLWRDTDRPDGWNALVWDTAERGWWLPTAIVPGDVIEFGASRHQGAGNHTEVTRWWGWIQRITAFGVVVVGPYEHPMRAVEAARPMVDELRLTQLPPPNGITELDAIPEYDN